MTKTNPIRAGLDVLTGRAPSPPGDETPPPDPYEGLSDHEVRMIRFHQTLAAQVGEDPDTGSKPKKARSLKRRPKRKAPTKKPAATPAERAHEVAKSFMAPELDPEPADTAPQDAALDLTPERVPASEIADFEPVDDETPVLVDDKGRHAIMLPIAGRNVPVAFQPSNGSMLRGLIRSAGGGPQTQEVIYDLIRRQWTTPAQRFGLLAMLQSMVRDALSDLLAKADDPELVDLLVRAIERSVVAFLRGDKSQADLQRDLREKQMGIARLVADKAGGEDPLFVDWQLSATMTAVSLASMIAVDLSAA